MSDATDNNSTMQPLLGAHVPTATAPVPLGRTSRTLFSRSPSLARSATSESAYIFHRPSIGHEGEANYGRSDYSNRGDHSNRGFSRASHDGTVAHATPPGASPAPSVVDGAHGGDPIIVVEPGPTFTGNEPAADDIAMQRALAFAYNLSWCVRRRYCCCWGGGGAGVLRKVAGCGSRTRAPCSWLRGEPT